MFVVTVNLGDFDLLQSRYGVNQVAVLVEARPGPTQGTIMQHPMIEARRRSGADVAGDRYQIPPALMSKLFDGSDVDYLDPLSEVDGGEPYEGQWIAAMQPVALPEGSMRRNRMASRGASNEPPAMPMEQEEVAFPDVKLGKDSDAEKTDLLVLVQYRLQKVISPVSGMRSALLLEGAFAVVSIVFVTLGLWLIVRRFSLPPGAIEREPGIQDASAATIKAR